MKWMRYVLCAAAVCGIAGCGKDKTVSSSAEDRPGQTVSQETDTKNDAEDDMEETLSDEETFAEDDTAVTIIGETSADFEEGSAGETVVDLAPDGSIIDPSQGVSSKDVFQAEDFSLQLPEGWDGSYITSESSDAGITYVAFYSKKCHEEITDGGWLFSIASYPDESYEEQPSYDVIDTWEDLTYVAIYPTDVQFEGASKKAKKQYQKMANAVEEILATFERTQFE